MKSTKLRTIDVGASPVQLCFDSPRRISLLFSPDSDPSVVVRIDRSDAVSASNGLTLSQATGPIRIAREYEGEASTWSWWAVATSSTASIAVMEVNDSSA